MVYIAYGFWVILSETHAVTMKIFLHFEHILAAYLLLIQFGITSKFLVEVVEVFSAEMFDNFWTISGGFLAGYFFKIVGILAAFKCIIY